MNCAEIKDELSAYIDGELTDARRAEVEAHVAGCANCRQQVAELRQLTAGIAAMPKAQPAPQFLAEVRGKLARGERSEPRSWQDALFHPFWPKVPIELAAVAAAVMIVSRFAIQQPPPQEYAAETEVAKTETREEAAPASAETVNRGELSAEKPAETTPVQTPAPAATPAEQGAGEILPANGGEVAQKTLSKDEVALAPAAPASESDDGSSTDHKAPARSARSSGSWFGGSAGTDQLAAAGTTHALGEQERRIDLAGRIDQPKQKMVIATGDAVALRDKARQIAAGLNGAIQTEIAAGSSVSDSLSVSNSFLVVLPAGSVEQFKSQLSLLTKPVGLAIGPIGNERTGAVSFASSTYQVTSQVQALAIPAKEQGMEDKKAFPTVVLEIQVVPLPSLPAAEPAN